MFHLFVLRAAARLTGCEPFIRQLSLPLAQDYRRKKAGRLGYVPARITEAGAVEPVSYHGSAHLLSLVEADGFFRVSVDVSELSAGETVQFVQLRGASS